MFPSLRAEFSIVLAFASLGLLLGACQPTGAPPGTDGSVVDNCDNPPCDSTDDDGPPGVAGGTADNDDCLDAKPIGGAVQEGFDMTLASTDGPSHAACSNQGSDQLDNDLWYCWTADCDGLALVETCGLTEVDTRIAVYDGCACPPTDGALLTCADDGCGVQTRASFSAESGKSYLVRVGMFPPTDAGVGAVGIRCGFAACPGEGDCEAVGAGPGCGDVECCNAVCSVDSLCCEDTWDDWCVQEAAGLCGDGFASCGNADNACTQSGEGPGCADADCCNAVCEIDPFCCLTQWDDTCVELEAVTCFTACSASAGDCAAGHDTSGCADQACCAQVCPRDTFCCTTQWDDGCAELAEEVCE